ncbi:MAG: sodium:proton antiporter [Alphaproteobacteria bacterium]|nr:sodium:proton antiporter [Alphaproteobacteria bacterium]
MLIVPFVGLILSFALLPIVASQFWHRRMIAVAGFWVAVSVVLHQFSPAHSSYWHDLFEIMLHDYLPFIALVGSLFVISAGIRLEGTTGGTPLRNTVTLAVGGVFASVIGTTAAALIFTRTLIDSNNRRAITSHIFIFAIVIIGNIGGSLTPLGDPPLLVGFLQGIPFGWFGQNLWPAFLFMMVALLTIFFVIDHFYFIKHRSQHSQIGFSFASLRIRGFFNLFLLLLLPLASLLIANFSQGVSFAALGLELPLLPLLTVVVAVVFSTLSLVTTPRLIYLANRFTVAPLVEVVVLFFGIFATISPVIAAVKSLNLTGLTAAIDPASFYFWGSGLFSSVLDNSPTFLIFLNLYPGSIAELMANGPKILIALCCGTVFMGALTYIGNAPNLLIRNLVEAEKIAMPNFFQYLFWVAILLLPLFVVLDWLIL